MPAPLLFGLLLMLAMSALVLGYLLSADPRPQQQFHAGICMLAAILLIVAAAIVSGDF